LFPPDTASVLFVQALLLSGGAIVVVGTIVSKIAVAALPEVAPAVFVFAIDLMGDTDLVSTVTVA